jgi:hypothetical protein
MTLIQVKLQKDNVFQIAWIEKKTTVKKGCWVTLKDDNNKWKVVDMYYSCDEKYFNSDWEVGGLGKRIHTK